MRLGFSTQEAYFTILGVLIVLSAIGTIIGNWLVSRAQGCLLYTSPSPRD